MPSPKWDMNTTPSPPKTQRSLQQSRKTVRARDNEWIQGNGVF